MEYKIELKPRAMKDLRKISRPQLRRIFNGIEEMSNDLKVTLNA